MGAGPGVEELNVVGPLVAGPALLVLAVLVLLLVANPEPTEAFGFVARVVPDCMAHDMPAITCAR